MDLVEPVDEDRAHFVVDALLSGHVVGGDHRAGLHLTESLVDLHGVLRSTLRVATVDGVDVVDWAERGAGRGAHGSEVDSWGRCRGGGLVLGEGAGGGLDATVVLAGVAGRVGVRDAQFATESTAGAGRSGSLCYVAVVVPHVAHD